MRRSFSILYAEVFVGNNRSRRVLEKNGFELVATNLAASVKLGQLRDEWLFERHQPTPSANELTEPD